MQKPRSSETGAFGSYAVQLHRAFGGFVVFIESPCYILKAVFYRHLLQIIGFINYAAIAFPTQFNGWIVLAFIHGNITFRSRVLASVVVYDGE